MVKKNNTKECKKETIYIFSKIEDYSQSLIRQTYPSKGETKNNETKLKHSHFHPMHWVTPSLAMPQQLNTIFFNI